MEDKVVLTIVIANYNYGRYIEDAIRSVVCQADVIEDKRLIVDGHAVELIICDGGSTDNSVEVIRKYEHAIYWWCSEPDGGQSAAFNKGFAHGTGKYLTWLNADDQLVPHALKSVVRQLVKHPDCEWFTGNALDFTNDRKIITCAVGPHWYPDFLQRKCSPIVVMGPTSFFSRRIYEQAGRIDESLHYTMDTYLWIKFIVAGVKQRRIRQMIWAFRRHEASKTAEFGTHKLGKDKLAQMDRELKAALKDVSYRPSRLMHGICLLFRLLDGSLIRRTFIRRFGGSVKEW